MTIEVSLVKGTRIRATWLEAKLVGLAGMQMKTGAETVSVTGSIRHFRGDHPTEPRHVKLYVDAEEGSFGGLSVECTKCGREHVEVDPRHIVEVFK